VLSPSAQTLHSTVPEVIAARHAGVRVLVLSLVTNIVVNAPYRSAEAAFEAEERGEKEIPGDSASGEKEEEVASHQEVSSRRSGV